MGEPVALAAYRLSGGRWAFVVSVAPGRRVTFVADGYGDAMAQAAAIASVSPGYLAGPLHEREASA